MTKEQAWKKIKTEHQDLADLLKGISQAFGKPEAIRVKIDGEVIVQTGYHWRKR